ARTDAGISLPRGRRRRPFCLLRMRRGMEPCRARLHRRGRGRGVTAAEDRGVDLPALLALATSTAREAGALLMARHEEWVSTVRTKRSPTDMVSDADHASER